MTSITEDNLEEDICIIAVVEFTVRTLYESEIYFEIKLRMESNTRMEVYFSNHQVILTDIVSSKGLEELIVSVANGKQLTIDNKSNKTIMVRISGILVELYLKSHEVPKKMGMRSFLHEAIYDSLMAFDPYPLVSRKLNLKVSFTSSKAATIRLTIRLGKDLVFYRATLPRVVAHNFDPEASKNINYWLFNPIYLSRKNSYRYDMDLSDAQIRYRPHRILKIVLQPLIYITLFQTVVNAFVLATKYGFSKILNTQGLPLAEIMEIIQEGVFSSAVMYAPIAGIIGGGIVVFLLIYLYLRKILTRILNLPTGIMTKSFMLILKLLFVTYATLLGIFFLTPYTLPSPIGTIITDIAYRIMQLMTYYSIIQSFLLTLITVVFTQNWHLNTKFLLMVIIVFSAVASLSIGVTLGLVNNITLIVILITILVMTLVAKVLQASSPRLHPR